MTCFFNDTLNASDEPVIDLHCLEAHELETWLNQAPEIARQWVQGQSYEAKGGRLLVVPNESGGVACVLLGIKSGSGDMYALAAISHQLPKGRYRLLGSHGATDQQRLLLGFALGAYRFDRYKTQRPQHVSFYVPPDEQAELLALVEASYLARDLVNTPANDMGPDELEQVAQSIAKTHGANIKVISGLELEESFPAIHTVGRASVRKPRLICLRWGQEGAPPLALVGKGVVFDTGGLSLKPTSGMVLMKKDMGGAAHVLALAQVIMSLGLDVDLRVYIPAVENAVAGNAYRPSDIITMRNGTTVEIGNTDAEGRLVLADALTLAAEEGASRIINMATLTGAARVALGEDLPPLYGRDQTQVRTLQDLSFELSDPLWPMPLFDGYRALIQPTYADLSNTGSTPQGGSVTAALFLDHFVPEAIDFYHLDIYAWNLSDRPGRPQGGEAQGIRSLWAWLKALYPA